MELRRCVVSVNRFRSVSRLLQLPAQPCIRLILETGNVNHNAGWRRSVVPAGQCTTSGADVAAE